MAGRATIQPRDFGLGDISDLQLALRDIQSQLRDSKQTNVLLKTENARLKKQAHDLTERLLSYEAGKPTKRGEVSTIGALRQAHAGARQDAQVMREQLEQLWSENEVLRNQVSDCQGQLDHASQGWTQCTADLEIARASLAELQTKCQSLTQDHATLLADLAAAKEALKQERQTRSDAEGQAGQLGHELELAQTQAQQQASNLQRQQQTLQQQLEAAMAETAAAMAALDAQKTLTKDEHSKATALLAQLQTLQAQLDALAALSSPVVPEHLSSAQGPLLALASHPQPQSSGAPQPAHSGIATSTATSPCAITQPDVNCVELVLHDATFTPEAAGVTQHSLWALLTCDIPGVASRPVLVCAEPGAAPVPIHFRGQSDFSTSGPVLPRALEVLTTQACSVTLYNLKASLLGGLKCPAPPHHVQAGQPVPMLACASQHKRLGATAVHLLSLRAQPGVLQPDTIAWTLSVDWQPLLPSGTAQPRPDEFVMPIQSLDALLVESVRMSGLFTAGRTFTGTDNKMYQVWAVQDMGMRRSATKKYLDQDLELAADLAVAARPLAATHIPLSTALATPSLDTSHRMLLAAAVQGQARPGLYESDMKNGTAEFTLRTPHDEPVGVCRATLRLARELPVLPVLMPAASTPAAANVMDSTVAAAAPANTQLAAVTGSALSAALPPVHWASIMAVEVLGLWRMLCHSHDRVAGAVAALVERPALDPRDQDTCQQAMLQATDMVQVLAKQLPSVEQALGSVCQTAAGVSPADEALARAWHQDVKRMVRRCALTELLLVAQAKHRVTEANLLNDASGGSGMSRAGSMATVCGTAPLPTSSQATMLDSLESALQQLCRQQHWLSSTSVLSQPQHLLVSALLTADAGVSLNGGSDGPSPALTTAGTGQPGSLATPDTPSVVVAAALSSLQAALGTAVPSVSHAIDVCRKQISAPGSNTDPVDTTTACQQRVTYLLGAVTSTLLPSAAALSQAVLAADDTTASQPAAATTTAEASAPAASVAALLASQVQLQVLLTQLGKCDPTGLPAAGQQSQEAWLKAAFKISIQICRARSLWTTYWVVQCAKSLVVSGQRTLGVKVVLDTLAGEAVRVIQSSANHLSNLRSNRLYPMEVVQPCLEPVVSHLTQRVVSTVSAVYQWSTQLLVAPVGVYTAGWGIHSSGVAPDTAATALQVEQQGLLHVSTVLDTADTASGSAGVQTCLPHWQPKQSLLLITGPSPSTGPAAPPGQALPQPGGTTPTGQATTLEELSITQAAAALGWSIVSLEHFRSQAQGDPPPSSETAPGAGLVPEAEVLARACAQVDAAVVLLPQSEAGSVVPRLRALGAVVLEPLQDTGLRRALAAAVTDNLSSSTATSAPSQAIPPPAAHPHTTTPASVLELARQIVARIAVVRYPRQGIQKVRAREVRRPGVTWMAPGPLAHYTSNTSLSEPLLAASQAVYQRVTQALYELLTSTQGSVVADGTDAMVRQAAARMVQGMLQFEGLLQAPALALALAAPQEAGAASKALTPSRSVNVSQDGSGRRTPGQLGGLPPLQRRLSSQSMIQAQQPSTSTVAAAAAALVAQPVSGAVQGGDSTESEDAEAHVTPLAAVGGQVGGLQAGVVDDAESDAASVVSSSAGVHPAFRTLR